VSGNLEGGGGGAHSNNAYRGEGRRIKTFYLENLSGRAVRRRKVNIKTNLRETGLESVNWTHLAEDRNGFRYFLHYG
jgi:hypothetical protein